MKLILLDSIKQLISTNQKKRKKLTQLNQGRNTDPLSFELIFEINYLNLKVLVL
jgi:hypothetical protein